jgi:hypothetical protein
LRIGARRPSSLVAASGAVVVLALLGSDARADGLLDVLKRNLPTQLPAQLPQLPTTVALPKDPDGISTSLDDAIASLALMARFTPDPAEARPAQRGPAGVTIGTGYYELPLQSYCLHAGSYRPKPRGDGYLLAPLRGPQAGVIGSILRNSAGAPDIAQSDIQTLIWAILSGTKPSRLGAAQQSAAQRLLSAQQLVDLNGGVLGFVPDDAMQSLLNRANAKVPDGYRRTVQAYSALRDRLQSGGYRYSELEAIAAPEGDGVGEKSRPIRSGEWMLLDPGYFIRVLPSGYSRTTVQIFRPLKATFHHDDTGRPDGIDFNDGYSVRTSYENDTAVYVDPKTARRYPHAITRSITLNGPTTGGPVTIAVRFPILRAQGFMHQQTARSRWHWPFVDEAEAAEAPGTVVDLRPLIQDLKEYKEAIDLGNEQWDETWRYLESRDHQGPVNEGDLQRFMDEQFYRDGLDRAFHITDFKAKSEWLSDFSARLGRAGAYITCALAGSCLTNDPGSTVTVDLPGYSAVSGNTAQQRLGLSLRSP